MSADIVEGIRGKIVDTVKARTKIWAERYGFADPVPDEQKSEKVRNLEKVLGDKLHTTHAPSFAALAAILCDAPVKVAAKPETMKYLSGVAITPVGNGNSHTYTLGKATINYHSSGPDYFMNRTGECGNHMSQQRRDVRPSTDAEIDEYFAAANRDTLQAILQELLNYKIE